MRGILPRRVRTRAGEPQVRHGCLLSNRRAGDARRPALVDSGVRGHVGQVAGMNPYLAGVPLGGSPESDVRKRFFAGQASGKWQMSDPDGNWIDITDE